MPTWPIDTTVLADDYIATLPFNEAQAVFAGRGPLGGSGRLTTCSWYGTRTDSRVGSFAIVDEDGPLADLLGERIKITVTEGGRSVYAWVADTGDLDEPLALTRRCFMALGPPALDSLNVLVEVVA